jgi:hypothetical protein
LNGEQLYVHINGVDQMKAAVERLEFWSEWLAQTNPKVLNAAGIARQIKCVRGDLAAISLALGLPPTGDEPTPPQPRGQPGGR